MRHYFSILPLAALLLAGCQTQDGYQIPDTQPDMRGNITSLKKTNSKKSASVAVLLVESIESVQTNRTKANLRIDGNTYIEDQDGASLRIEQLREGQVVEAWFDEQVVESFPEQAHASAIRVSN